MLKNQNIKQNIAESQRQQIVSNNQILSSKKFSQLYEIKILDSREHDEQLKLTRSCIKNKSFEVTKESK